MPRGHHDGGSLQAPQRNLPSPPGATRQLRWPGTSYSEPRLCPRGARSADGDLLELDSWGNGFVQLQSGGTLVLGPQAGATATSASSMATAAGRCSARDATMTRPVSLGEVLASAPLRRRGIALPATDGAATLVTPQPWPAAASMESTVLSAAEGERFILVHGDNYGCMEKRCTDGTWRPLETVAEYMPAGIHRRYLRRVGETHGEFQRRTGAAWQSEGLTGVRQHRLYLIDGRFEILTDAEYERRHGTAGGTMSI